MKEQKEKKEKRVVKRYRNRKLYDTLDSCYVTLEDIAELVRAGEDICVIDNNSQEDLTSVTLAQIILEEERRKKDALPLGTLFQLIRSGGATLASFVHKSLGEGVREISSVKNEIYDNLEKLVSRGSISHDESNRLLGSIRDFIESKIRPTVENVQNIPSVQQEVKFLRKKLEDLEKKFEPPKKCTKR